MNRLLFVLILAAWLTPVQAKGPANRSAISKLVKICKIASRSKTAHEKIIKYAPAAESAEVIPHLLRAAMKDKNNEDPRVFEACWKAIEAYSSEQVATALLTQINKAEDRDEIVFCLSLLDSLPQTTLVEKTNQPIDLTAVSPEFTATFTKTLLPLLKNNWWPARLATCRALRMVKSPAVGNALIRLVTSKPGTEKRRIRDAAMKTLSATWPGAPKIEEPADNWGTWWVQTLQNNNLPIPKDLADRQFKSVLNLYTKPYETIDYFGTKIRSDAFILVTDYSNSMGPQASLTKEVKSLRKKYHVGEEFEGPLRKITLDVQTKHECVVRKQIELLALMPSKLKFNLVYFNGSVTTFKPIKELTTLSAKTKNDAITFLTKKMGLSHGTKLYEGLEIAFQNEEADEFFVLSDGRPFNSKVLDTGVIERACFRWQILRQARFNCVDLGPILGGIKWKNPAKKAGKMKPSEYLERIANSSGGKYTLYESLKGLTFYEPDDKAGS